MKTAGKGRRDGENKEDDCAMGNMGRLFPDVPEPSVPSFFMTRAVMDPIKPAELQSRQRFMVRFWQLRGFRAQVLNQSP